MVEFGETTVTTSSKDLYYDMEEVFPDDVEELRYDKFEIAFAFTSYDEVIQGRIDDPKYGRIYARYNSWGYGWQNQNLETHPCTDEELGLAGTNETSRFYPIHPNF